MIKLIAGEDYLLRGDPQGHFMLHFPFLEHWSVWRRRVLGARGLDSGHACTHALPSKVGHVMHSAGKESEGLQPKTFRARGKEKDIPETYLHQLCPGGPPCLSVTTSAHPLH